MSDEWMIGIIGMVIALIYNVTFPDGSPTVRRSICRLSVLGLMMCMFWLGRVTQ